MQRTWNRSRAVRWGHGNTAHTAPGGPTPRSCCLHPEHQHTHTDLLSLHFQLGMIKLKFGITHLPPSIFCITNQLANNKLLFSGILDALPITFLLLLHADAICSQNSPTLAILHTNSTAFLHSESSWPQARCESTQPETQLLLEQKLKVLQRAVRANEINAEPLIPLVMKHVNSFT